MNTPQIEALAEVFMAVVARRGGEINPEAAYNCAEAIVVAENQRIVQAEKILTALDATFTGRDADGAPGADGSYWLGHSQALAIWYWLHPDHRTDGDISL